MNQKLPRDKTQFGTPVQVAGPKPIPNHLLPNPALGWKLSPEAERDIEAIEHNAATALSRIGHYIIK